MDKAKYMIDNTTHIDLENQLDNAKRIQKLIEEKEKEIRELQQELSYCIHYCYGYVIQTNKTNEFINKLNQDYESK